MRRTGNKTMMTRWRSTVTWSNCGVPSANPSNSPTTTGDKGRLEDRPWLRHEELIMCDMVWANTSHVSHVFG